MKKFIFVALAILPLASCTVYGNKSIKEESQQTVASKIIKGKTTQQEILKMYGEPQTRAMNDGKETWGYSVTSGKSSITTYIPVVSMFTNGATASIKSMDIWFKGNVVEGYNFVQTSSSVSNGLLD
ncbi:hypothetical protein MXM41_09580 [Leclercia adecarboxylata]|uniref:hypothetical protein n=1 Tax=Leclercia adecarboxylata TaxID=83655 RepID=UPI002DB9C106|nr:hypothetical protein [Leclercia adecarboxylata]MEB6379181.1 hypothetical protein [Leclercia adecarboxylata]